ncbi:hypothetical protein [Catenulispora rubra]|uniref:hypothetical protein n=1 Tax=Catenulispora rubra TaxID=280293 RepID=UPI001892117D|nr:hypothetical protein [Catenulispora rubra]
MSFRTRAYDDETGRPVVVLVATGSHAVSRLVAALRTGSTEQMMLAGRLIDQVKRHNGGREALRLLAAHGGPDLLAEEAELAWHTVRRFTDMHPIDNYKALFYEVTHPEQCHYLPPGAVCWFDHNNRSDQWPAGEGTCRMRPVEHEIGGDEDGPYLAEFLHVQIFDTEAGTWHDLHAAGGG